MKILLNQNIFYPNNHRRTETKVSPKISFGEDLRFKEKSIVDQGILDKLASVGIIASCTETYDKEKDEIVITRKFNDTVTESKEETTICVDPKEKEKSERVKASVIEQFYKIAIGYLVDRIIGSDENDFSIPSPSVYVNN